MPALPKRLEKDDLCAGTSGVLLALSFPSSALWFLAWFALVPWLLTLHRRPFRSGLIAGGVFFALLLYWLNIVMTRYGGLNLFFSLVAYLLLVAYLSLYFGAAAWLAERLRRTLGLSLLVAFPLCWTTAELLRAHLLTGFPWGSLGYSQQALPLFIQSADLWGVAGLGLLIVLVNLLIARSWRNLRRKRGRLRALVPLGLAILLLAGNGFYGHIRLEQFGTATDRKMLSVAVAQGNIEQGVKWEPAYLERTLARYASLTEQASEQEVDLVVWPESATPFFFQENSPQSRFVREVTRRSGGALLFGSPAYGRRGDELEYYNSAFLLSPEGVTLGRSDKVHLVPFGEYVPLQWLLPFIDKLVVGIGDFSPGRLQPIELGEVGIGVLVCYEVIFPELARRYVARGADLLVNITNDAWFGTSSAPYQHLAMVSLRAVENRVWIARAANTGISAFVAPTGEVIGATGLFVEAFRVQRLDAQAAPGIYHRVGHLLPWLCGAVVLILVAASIVRGRRKMVAG